MKRKVYFTGTIILALCGVLTMVKTNQKPSTPAQAEAQTEVEAPVAEVVETPQASEQQPATVAETPVMVASASVPETWSLTVGGTAAFNENQVFEKPLGATNAVAVKTTE